MKKFITLFLLLILSSPIFASGTVKKIFFFGDSTSGWMADRLNAYGEKNGFEVAGLTWDGANIKKYGTNSAALARYIKNANPDAIFISLGMNEMGTRNPDTQLLSSLNKIKSVIGNIPIIWIGPPCWPGKAANYGHTLDKWLSTQLGASHYYSSLNLSLPRQSSTNPHPTRAGVNTWIDGVVKWLESGKAAVALPGYAKPAKEYSRPKNFTYRRMKAGL